MKVQLSISAAAAVLALVGPSAALAGSSPDDRAVPMGTSWNQVKQATGTPDDRALARGTSWTVKSKTVIATPDDRSFARSFPSLERPTLVRVSSGGFDWTDAGVGAASGFGIALVLLGAGMIFLRRGSGRPVAA
jgi:hypothetical protein